MTWEKNIGTISNDLALGEDWVVWSGISPDGVEGVECRSDINGPQHDCVIWAEHDMLRHCQFGDTCRQRDNG